MAENLGEQAGIFSSRNCELLLPFQNYYLAFFLLSQIAFLFLAEKRGIKAVLLRNFEVTLAVFIIGRGGSRDAYLIIRLGRTWPNNVSSSGHAFLSTTSIKTDTRLSRPP